MVNYKNPLLDQFREYEQLIQRNSVVEITQIYG